ncbi:MAG TPA: DUF3073 domain-containing protein [Intrasporangium sp.]|jgi:hypothetical protein|nr:DUF3073 domain-containing protein [Intrasporangium sp.]
MGRGRAKAKQTKVARQLKYYTPETDLSALERELHRESSGADRDDTSRPDEDDYDEYGKWAAGER